MKIPYRKVFLFGLILVVLLFLMDRWMDREFYPHYPLQYDEVFHPKVNANVIILGASHATHGINPKHLESEGSRIYNFAMNGASSSFTLNWYKKIFQRHYKKPSHILYGVHWTMFDSQLLTRRLEQDSKYFPFSFFVEEMGNPKTLKALLLNRFSLIRERKQLLSRVVQLFKEKHREVYIKSAYYQGFIPFETKRNLNAEAVDPKVEQAQFNAFEELLNEFEREGIKVIFVQVPEYLYGIDSSTLSKNTNLLKKIAEERKIPFLNYETERRTAINTNRDFFSDAAHLNGKGSEAFTKLLKHDLNGLLY
jgi:hypothetical protein